MNNPELPGNDDKDPNLTPLSIESGYITLPFDNKQFKDFIIGLLGKPQVFEKKTKKVFLVRLRDIANLHELIQQRLTQQNHATLIQVEVSIYFSDGASFRFNSLDELFTYNEVRASTTKALRITWAYLINFGGKEYPERQEIEIYFDTDMVDKYDYEAEYDRQKNQDKNIQSSIFEKVREGFLEWVEMRSEPTPISYSIRTTNRGWAIDISNLLDNYLAKVDWLREEPFWGRYANTFSWLFGNLFFLSSSLFAGRHLLQMYRDFSDEIIAKNQELIAEKIDKFVTSKELLEDKISGLAELFLLPNSYSISEGAGFVEFVSLNAPAMVFFLTTLFVLKSVLERGLRTPKRSSILITEEDKILVKKMKTSGERMVLAYIVSIMVAIGVNIFSNYLFESIDF